MSARPVAAMTEAVAADILRDAQATSMAGADVPAVIAVHLADEILHRGGWKANTCKPLIRAYELALVEAS